MKLDVDTPAKLRAWLTTPGPAVFQGQDLTGLSDEIAGKPLADCAFLGCRMTTALKDAAAEANCFLIPPRDDLPFNPFLPGLYSPADLFDKLADGGTYADCLDRRIYEWFIDPETQLERPADVDLLLLRRIHDASVAEALQDFLDLETQLRTVAIMGGHNVLRTAPVFRAVAELALQLALEGYLVLTGGGPGLMEAANLGAYCAGFPDPVVALDAVLAKIGAAPRFDDPEWLPSAYAAWQELGPPADRDKSRNVGIPTWFYGHEPPNLFATHIAKYFENSVREEGLLAVALGGVIFAEGNAGTVQEIFQDACQNYYRTFAKVKSPMVLFGSDYWNPADLTLTDPDDRRKPVYPLLEKLATERDFIDFLLLTDDTATIVKFIREHPPV